VWPSLLFIIPAALLALVLTVRRNNRDMRLNGFRRHWGKARKRSHKMEAISASYVSRIAPTGSEGSLDSRTWTDLNLDEVFLAIDRTESTLGQHALYHRLRTTPVGAHLDAFEALVHRMSSDTPAREHAQLALSRLQDDSGYDLWWMVRPNVLEVQPWYIVFPVLGAAMLLTLMLVPFRPHAVAGFLLAVGISVAVRLATDSRIGAVTGAFRQLAPLIAAAQSLSSHQVLKGDDIAPLVGSLATDVPRLSRLKTIARWVSGDPFMLRSSATTLFTSMLTDVVNGVYEYFNLFFLLDANAVYFGARELGANSAALLRVLAAMGEVDAAISVASFRVEAGAWTTPQFHGPAAPVVWTDIRHPLVEEAVPNSIGLAPPNGVLITGSNMSGKSTFLRTAGVNAVLAQTIHTCLATRYEAPIFNVRTCIGRSDDLLAGKSYYIVEVEALLELVQASRSSAPHLFLLDELFRGTNAVERIAAAEAVLMELVLDGETLKPHIVIAATHDGELVDLLREVYATYHFADRVGSDGLMFEYRLQPGPATTRNAITLLELNGAPPTLVARALARAKTLDQQRKISTPV